MGFTTICFGFALPNDLWAVKPWSVTRISKIQQSHILIKLVQDTILSAHPPSNNRPIFAQRKYRTLIPFALVRDVDPQSL